MANLTPSLPIINEAIDLAAPVISMTFERMAPNNSISHDDLTKFANPVI